MSTFDSNPHDRLGGRPSELLPWADPCIANLVTQLQDEVRDERRRAKRSWRAALAELEPPSPNTDTDFDLPEDPRWSFWD